MALLSTWTRNTFRTILPSFLADLVWPEHRSPRRLHPTSYLDGLRGLASFIVFFCHYTENNHAYLIPAYGLGPEDAPSSWIQLPFLRIIFSGRPMVHIFFIISGFVLSYKPLKTIHAREFDKCFSVLASSAFRRPIRLFGPCVVSTFIILFLIQGGWIEGEPLPTWSEEYWRWISTLFRNITWPWAWDDDLRPLYDVHLWTIPIEYVHSMLLFMVITMLSRVRRPIRQATVFGMMLYFLRCGKWAAFEFIGGMFLAELVLLKAAREKSWEFASDDFSPKSAILPMVKTTLHVSVIVVWLFIGGWPNDAADRTPGIRYLLARTPEPFASKMDHLAPQKFYFAIAAIVMVWSAGELALVKRFLEGSLSQYLGRVSYAVYICHGPVMDMMQLRILGHPFIPAKGTLGEEGYVPAVDGYGVKNMFGIDTPSQRTASWFFGLLMLGPMVIWAADIFWRLVDNPVIAAAKKLENLCLDNTEEADKQAQDKYSLSG